MRKGLICSDLVMSLKLTVIGRLRCFDTYMTNGNGRCKNVCFVALNLNFFNFLVFITVTQLALSCLCLCSCVCLCFILRSVLFFK